MPDVSVLDVLLYGKPIGMLTHLPGERTILSFRQDYIDDPLRPTASLSFKDSSGALITDLPSTRVRVPPFFANMLPEGALRDYLAKRACVNPKREFFLLWVLGLDLPGAVTVRAADGEDWPPAERGEAHRPRRGALRFSLAGVQLKFSAIQEATGGLTVPAEGIGGSWILKLPSVRFDRVPENEFGMMNLARLVGMDVPEIRLVDLDTIDGLPEDVGSLKGQALAVRRFDRGAEGPVHIEDFAQVFGVYPEEKYKKASYRNIAEVIGIEAGQADVAEFIRRLVFNTLIGNADMHLKNWSLIYRDRRRARLAPAYDFVSTIVYLPDNEAALRFARTRRMDELSLDELAYLAARARLPQRLVLVTARETVERFQGVWRAEKKNLPIARAWVKAIEKHITFLPIAREAARARPANS